jgi:uncharacterized membrane protein
LCIAIIAAKIGWLWETWYCKSDRGADPSLGLLPIYGAGGFIIDGERTALECTTLSLIIEFLGSKLFDPERKLWDYSSQPLNIDGRICAKSAAFFLVSYVVCIPLFDYLQSINLLKPLALAIIGETMIRKAL